MLHGLKEQLRISHGLLGQRISQLSKKEIEDQGIRGGYDILDVGIDSGKRIEN